MMRPMSEPSVLAWTTMRRRPFSRRTWFGPSPSSTSAKVRSGTRPRRFHQQPGQRLRRAPGVGQAQHHVEPLLPVHDLADHLAVAQLLQRVGQRRGGYAVQGGPVVVEAHLKLRHAHLALHQQVHQAGDRAHASTQVLGQAAQGVEVVAEQLDRDGSVHAGQQVLQSVPNGLGRC